MADIRLSKLIKQFNIGLDTLVDFLNSKGAGIEDANPNMKVSDEFMPELHKKFGKDLELKEAAEKVDVKLTEILDKASKRQDDDEWEPERVTVIKSNNLSRGAEAAKPAEQAEAPAEEPAAPKAEAAEPKAEAEPAAPKAAPKKAPAKPKAEPKPKPKAEVPEEKAEVPAAEPAEPKPEVQVEEPVEAKAEEAPAAAPEAPAAEAVEDQPEAPAPTPAGENGDSQLRVLGKIDLSQFDPKKSKKRERIKSGGSQKVDVSKVQADKGGAKKNDARKKADAAASGKARKKGERFKPAMTEAEQEDLQKEIQKQVKETYARMNENKNNFGAKHRKEKREIAAIRSQEEMEAAAAENKILKVTEFVTVNDLATLMNNTPVVKVIGACMSLGMMVSINQRLDAETLVLVAEEFGYKVEFVTAELTEEVEQQEPDREEDLVERPPVITVMGHVDHGKTSLLDNIRNSNVIAGEAGGITQHIGAYNVTLPSGRHITFLDTPGHEAFTAMRARGAQMTDLAIIIVAADDAVMPQTKEAISHAQAAGVPMVFAINKIDKPGANPDTIRRQLSEMNILVEDWGGKYQCQEISAKKGINVDKLLEKVLFETDLLELKANPKKLGSGAVIESSLDKGRGYLATVLVQDGTMRVGDVIISGAYYGRVKAMFNERGQKVESAGPSTPVSILGLNGAPAAGEKFNVMADEKEAKSIAQKREQLIRIQGIKTQKHLTLEEIGRRIAIGNFKELNVIVKGDVDGSVEALSDSLIKLSTEEVRVNVIHKAVGAISESDVLLAEASDAVIIGFQVRPSAEARRSAEKEGIEIRLYSVIYDCINEVKEGIEGMLEPEKKEEVTATAEVKQTFKISKVGTIAGCQVKEGKLTAKASVRLIRDGIVVYTGELSSLQRGKDNAKEVPAGMECGCGLDRYNDIHPGDIIEAFQIVEIKRSL
ncbi:MAG: translation initiation factor IF-2 [Bacteroidales bacterium]|nr:translation initiation factor IF-2 [Bacteroidales bacterium]